MGVSRMTVVRYEKGETSAPSSLQDEWPLKVVMAMYEKADFSRLRDEAYGEVAKLDTVIAELKSLTA